MVLKTKEENANNGGPKLMCFSGRKGFTPLRNLTENDFVGWESDLNRSQERKKKIKEI